jgi:hypothetical protein
VIGEEPRGRATAELGERAPGVASARAVAVLERALRDPRGAIAEALDAGVAALAALRQLRLERARDQVPQVATPAWIRHLEYFRDGDWERARLAAETRLAEPAA